MCSSDLRISQINAVTGMPEKVLSHVPIYPASHYITPKDKMDRAVKEIERELWDQVKFFEEHDKLLTEADAAQAEMGTGRDMGPGWITVAADSSSDGATVPDNRLTFWLTIALTYNKTVTRPS